MIAANVDAAVTVVLQALEERYGAKFVRPNLERQPVFGELPCIVKFGNGAIDATALKNQAMASRRLTSAPTWGEIACFFGETLRASLPGDVDPFQFSGMLGVCSMLPCQFRDDDDPNHYL
ncbi:MAG: hypothetical protein WCG99_04265 [Candidatus Berkelbacteria bacterium]